MLRVLSLRSRFEHAADSFLKRRAGLVAFEPGERFALLRWLHAPELPLIGVTEARAALIRLGNALGGLPEDRDVWPWKQLIILAHHADTVAHTTEGWEQLRDRIEVLAKALNQHVKRGSFDTLSAAVQALRAS